MPSSPMLSPPARSEIVSPRAATRSGMPARRPPATRAVRKVSVRTSLTRAPPPERGREPGREVARAQLALAAQVLRHGREEEEEGNGHEAGGRVPVRPAVAPGAEELGRGREVDDGAAHAEGRHHEARHG